MPQWKHVHLLLTPGLVAAVGEWQKKSPMKPDRNQAIRYLLTQALQAEGVEVVENEEKETGLEQE